MKTETKCPYCMSENVVKRGFSSTETEVKGIDMLENICSCSSKECSIDKYYNLPNIRKIEEKNVYELIARGLSEKVPQYVDISKEIMSEIIPLAKDNMAAIKARLSINTGNTASKPEELMYFA